ncbi:hypothetical protein Ahy_B09g094559 [Arachis hypogaea]|uniref:WPP domain-containing protein n=1 Tax=Arachis hypogaea TaxID=3818 RepID=A0A444XBI6_ARAHY|nr:hypothetical protein Ahy_B09g094559 [Arachis hypogaea]
MDEIVGHIEGRYDVSLADSTMMWIVQYGMNKAQERMKTKTGVIERLNEISKFYELAVMQLEGCLNIVKAGTENKSLESNHEEVLEELREIKDRLQGRLEESELAISEKDRELTELKERGPMSPSSGPGTGTATSPTYENDQTTRNKHSKGDVQELRTCMDQHIQNMKQRVETKHGKSGEASQRGIDRKKIEEMGSDIGILKQTMDLAFTKMQSALVLCEMRPKERQWKLAIEKDVMSILIRSFSREFQENADAKERKKEDQVLKHWQEHYWPQMMNEVTCLQYELANLNETCAEDSDCSALSSPTKASQDEGCFEKPRSPKKVDEAKPPKVEENEDGSNIVAKLIKSHESIIRRTKEEMKLSKLGLAQDKKASSSKIRRERLKERIRAVIERLDNLTDRNDEMSESFRESKTLPRRRLSEIYETDIVNKDTDHWESTWENEIGVFNAEKGQLLTTEKRYNTMARSKAQGIHGSVGKGMVEEFNSISYSSVIEMLIQESVFKCYLINQWNEYTEENIIERKISDDIIRVLFSEVAKDISSNPEFALTKCQCGKAEEYGVQVQRSTCSNQEDEIECTIREDICSLMFRKTCEEFNTVMEGCNVDSTVREEIYWIVSAETMKSFADIASYASREKSDNNTSLVDQLQFIITESILKEDVSMVVFKAMLKEWKNEAENYYMENLIREQIHQFIMVETLIDAILLSMEVKSQGHYNISGDNYPTVMLNQVLATQGEENMTIVLLESLLRCFEAGETLLLCAQSEINEHSKQLDLGSEYGDLHEHEIFEDLITGEERTFFSLNSKVENVLQQLGISKALLRELGSNLGHRLSNSESFHHHTSSIEEEYLHPASSVFLPLLNLSRTFPEFEVMVSQNLQMMTVRLEKMKCCLDSVIELVDSLRNKQLLYQKAFIRRCQNLQDAEAEVDLLGDQVEELLTLLEQIYVTLALHAPTLQQYFEVSNILELIKAELIRGASQTLATLIGFGGLVYKKRQSNIRRSRYSNAAQDFNL